MPISYDGVAEAFNLAGVECLQEYPVGDATFADAVVPEKRSEYLELWYASPDLWDIEPNAKRSGLAGYTRCGEAKMSLRMQQKMNMCDVVFVASRSAKEFHSQYLNVPVDYIWGGIKPELFYYMERDFRANPFVFLHVGAVDWRKGTSIACTAFMTSFPTESDVELVIISPGATPEFLRLQEKYASETRIKFVVKVILDRSKMMEEYYSLGHCLVYPSIIEGWGRCLAEAMATGMPCICPQTSAMAEEMADCCGWWVGTELDNTGYAIPTIDSLAAQMRLAYSNREMCEVKGRNAAERAKHQLIWDIGVKHCLPILERLYTGKDLTDGLQGVSNAG